MSWAKLDDRANEHEKQLAAGAKACWMWACGLMYCNRQPKRLGRIPKAVAEGGMLYPGTGRKDAKKLVDVGLWEDCGEFYQVHNYHGWNPELSEKRSEAGRRGGQASGEARREAKPEANTKQLASEDEANHEAKSEPRARTPAPAPAGARGIHTTTTTTPRQEFLPENNNQDFEVSCPADLRLLPEQVKTLETSMVPDWAIPVLTARFVSSHQADPADKRTLVVWRKCLSRMISGDWNNVRARPKRPVSEGNGGPVDDTGGYGNSADWYVGDRRPD